MPFAVDSAMLANPNLLVTGRCPTAGGSIDWTHPLAKGLVMAGRYGRDLVTGSVLNLGSATGVDASATHGPMYNYPAASVNEWTQFPTESTYKSFASEVTLAMACKFSFDAPTVISSGAYHVLFDNTWNNSEGFRVFISGNTGSPIVRWRLFAGGSGTNNDVARVTGDWYAGEDVILTFTYDGANLKQFINGVQHGSATAKTGTINNPLADFRIGQFYNQGGVTAVSSLHGSVAAAYIYQRALSATEIAALARDMYQFMLPV